MSFAKHEKFVTLPILPKNPLRIVLNYYAGALGCHSMLMSYVNVLIDKPTSMPVAKLDPKLIHSLRATVMPHVIREINKLAANYSHVIMSDNYRLRLAKAMLPSPNAIYPVEEMHRATSLFIRTCDVMDALKLEAEAGKGRWFETEITENMNHNGAEVRTGIWVPPDVKAVRPPAYTYWSYEDSVKHHQEKPYTLPPVEEPPKQEVLPIDPPPSKMAEAIAANYEAWLVASIRLDEREVRRRIAMEARPEPPPPPPQVERARPYAEQPNPNMAWTQMNVAPLNYKR